MVIVSDGTNSFQVLKILDPQLVITAVIGVGGTPIVYTPANFTVATTFAVLSKVTSGAISIAALNTLTVISNTGDLLP